MFNIFQDENDDDNSEDNHVTHPPPSSKVDVASLNTKTIILQKVRTRWGWESEWHADHCKQCQNQFLGWQNDICVVIDVNIHIETQKQRNR